MMHQKTDEQEQAFHYIQETLSKRVWDGLEEALSISFTIEEDLARNKFAIKLRVGDETYTTYMPFDEAPETYINLLGDKLVRTLLEGKP